MRIEFEGTAQDILQDMKLFIQGNTPMQSGISVMAPCQNTQDNPSKDPDPAAPITPAIPENTPVTPATPKSATVMVQDPTTEPALPQTEKPASAVPTAPIKEYTIDELLQACAPLMDANKIEELQQLMTQFGVQSMMDIPAERYGELATALRALGARI